MQAIFDALAHEPGLLIPLVLGSLGIIGGLSVPIAIQWRIVRTTEENNLLKQALLDRGLSPSEIATIMNAGASRLGRSHRCGVPNPGVSDPTRAAPQPGARAC